MDSTLDGQNGPWGGFWIQGKVRGRMRLRLKFQDGRISGEGKDSSGTFSMAGTYRDGDRVTILKSYSLTNVLFDDACPLLTYEGRWDGELIHGTWRDAHSSWNSGEFELWPISGEYLVHTLFERGTAGVLAPL